jgi:YegS/Rv2252/BmrU family lipid kinase
MSVTIIINPISGGASPEQARARAQLASAVVDRHGDPAEVFITEAPGHARELAKAAVRRGSRLVISWGGDGTLNEVASALAFQDDVPLGLVPAGSGNGFARELRVSRRPERAIAEAISAEPRAIDVGEVDNRLFVNVAGFGFDAYVAALFDRSGGRRGFAGYVAMTARALATYVAPTYTITTAEGCRVSRAILVTVANSAQFGNGARIAPQALLDDGLLDLVVVHERTRWRTICQIPRLFNGSAERIPGCSIRRIQRATIASDRPMLFHVDGEPVQGGTEVRVRVHPAALRVAVR